MWDRPTSPTSQTTVDTPNEHLERHPVIAWRIHPDGSCAGAITPDPENDLNALRTGQYILYPDGRVIHPGCSEWQTLDTWQTNMRNQATTTASTDTNTDE